MKTKLVLWGTEATNEKVLIALELKPDLNKVEINTFPKAIVADDFSKKMMEEWRNGNDVEFPEGYKQIERELTVADSILPDDLKADRPEFITRAQTEWHFLVLSTKLNQVYKTELTEFKEKVEGMTAYSAEMWDNLKGFWEKVQGQVSEKNLFREHADLLRDGINDLFGKLKDLRTSLNNEFEAKSTEMHAAFMATLDAIEEKIKVNPRTQSNFDDLKRVQSDYREATMTRDHRNQIWERIDGAFKMAKGERTTTGEFVSATARIQNRLEGLNGAIAKMEVSVNRDKEELDFQKKKIATTDGQLEAQLRQAKLRMIEERYVSKKAKLDEMIATRAEVEKAFESAKEKEAKRGGTKTSEATPTEAKKEESNSVIEETPAEIAAVNAIESTSPLSDTLEHAVEDTIDIVKAVAEVAAEKIENFVESLLSDDKNDEDKKEA